jgi:hypothetical protein
MNLRNPSVKAKLHCGSSQNRLSGPNSPRLDEAPASGTVVADLGVRTRPASARRMCEALAHPRPDHFLQTFTLFRATPPPAHLLVNTAVQDLSRPPMQRSVSSTAHLKPSLAFDFTGVSGGRKRNPISLSL